ncbi:hypothetical protein [Vibrio methylphosphonaticus]|uniref:hypothetical protein n=1 Tax=Vibrio methylphosphonaticus TaxID=2946866 RepID=UPI00202A6A1B|nr:hypothetical protein [Vibrio methylphosphonaticus]MCL9776634.1 hypothetical protein [Vibrio methylphosphonaticus]
MLPSLPSLFALSEHAALALVKPRPITSDKVANVKYGVVRKGGTSRDLTEGTASDLSATDWKWLYQPS